MERKIYFAASIRGGRNDQLLYYEIIQILKNYGTVLTEHIGDPNLGDSGEDLDEIEIFERDIDYIRQSHIVVAEVTVKSDGVGIELGVCYKTAKPTLVIYRPSVRPILSAMIAGCRYFTVARYENVTDLPEILDEFFGQLEMS